MYCICITNSGNLTLYINTYMYTSRQLDCAVRLNTVIMNILLSTQKL